MKSTILNNTQAKVELHGFVVPPKGYQAGRPDLRSAERLAAGPRAMPCIARLGPWAALFPMN